MNGLDDCLYMLWVLLKEESTKLWEPSVSQQQVSKPAQTEILPHFTGSGLNKENLLFIPY